MIRRTLRTGDVYNIPDGVKVMSYPYGVLGSGGGVKKIIIPASVEKIRDFSDCYVGKDAICVCYGKEPPVLMDKFTPVAINLTVYVPKGCKAAYESAASVIMQLFCRGREGMTISKKVKKLDKTVTGK